MQAAAIVAAQQQQQQAAAVQHAGTGGATPEGSAPGSEPVGFTYRNRSRRKATEKPVVRQRPTADHPLRFLQ